MKLERFADILACPATGEALAPSADGARLIAASGASYEVRGGVPILLTPQDRAKFAEVLDGAAGRAMAAEYDAIPADRLKPQPPPPKPFPPFVVPNDIVDRAVHRKGDATRILSVGGGPTRNSANDINLNMAPFREVDVVGNATRLPFRTSSVDGVWCNAVLEHVDDFAAAIAEMVRVVETGGTVMVMVPFLQALHGYPTDFQRFTAEGLAFQMRALRIVAKGEAVGASFTTWQIVQTYLDGPGMTTLPRWVRGIARRTLLPALKRSSMDRTDLALPQEQRILSSVVYCFGVKE